MRDNDFQIQASKLDTLEQREIATRTLLLLYAFHKLLHDQDYDSNATPYKEISSQLDQLETKIIPQIRGVYNAKRELEKLEPLLFTLKELEQKKGEIDL